jgi:hypothetical protein
VRHLRSPDDVAQGVGQELGEREVLLRRLPKVQKQNRAIVRLPLPSPGYEVPWVTKHLGHLCCDTPAASGRFRGTQQAADAALHTFDVSGYAKRRNDVWPVSKRGASDPALAAHPELPAVFVFDEPLLARLRLSGKRLVFLTERLAELADSREVELALGDPAALLRGRAVATTFAPVPGWATRAANIKPVAIHPWPWLRRPDAGSLTSYTNWVKRVGN